MRLFAYAAGVMLAGLALQMGMVVRLIEPSLGLSLLGYASLFLGMLFALLGAMGRRGR